MTWLDSSLGNSLSSPTIGFHQLSTAKIEGENILSKFSFQIGKTTNLWLSRKLPAISASRTQYPTTWPRPTRNCPHSRTWEALRNHPGSKEICQNIPLKKQKIANSHYRSHVCPSYLPRTSYGSWSVWIGGWRNPCSKRISIAPLSKHHLSRNRRDSSFPSPWPQPVNKRITSSSFQDICGFLSLTSSPARGSTVGKQIGRTEGWASKSTEVLSLSRAKSLLLETVL